MRKISINRDHLADRIKMFLLDDPRNSFFGTSPHRINLAIIECRALVDTSKLADDLCFFLLVEKGITIEDT